MPVEYSEWVSIAFRIAREKGATFETSQEEIESGTAPTSEAVAIFAEIWQERKSEIVPSVSDAEAVAREEIEV